MTSTKSHKEASNKYNKANTKIIPLRLNLRTDADILAILDQVQSKNGFIKEAIRKMEPTLEQKLAILTDDALQAYETGELTDEDLDALYKAEMVRRISKWGDYGSTYSECLKWIPDDVYEALTARQIAQLVDAFKACYDKGVAFGRRNNE